MMLKIGRPLKLLLLVAGFVFLFWLMSGCASMTEEYWAERYVNMTPEEIEAAKALGGELVQVCDLTDCIFIWIY